MRRRAGALLALTALAACSLDPHYVRPTPAVPAGWPVGDAYLRSQEAALPSVAYPQVFRDPHLQTIIAAALAHNQDLAAAIANIDAARAQYRVARAALLPTITADAGVTRASGLLTGGGGTSSGGSTTGTGTTGTGTTGTGTTGTGTTGTGTTGTGTTGTTTTATSDRSRGRPIRPSLASPRSRSICSARSAASPAPACSSISAPRRRRAASG